MWAKKTKEILFIQQFALKKALAQNCPNSLVLRFRLQDFAGSIFGYAFFYNSLIAKLFRSFLRQYVNLHDVSGQDFLRYVFSNILQRSRLFGRNRMRENSVMLNLVQHLLTKLSHGLEMSNDISVSKTRVKITKCESFGFQIKNTVMVNSYCHAELGSVSSQRDSESSSE